MCELLRQNSDAVIVEMLRKSLVFDLMCARTAGITTGSLPEPVAILLASVRRDRLRRRLLRLCATSGCVRRAAATAERRRPHPAPSSPARARAG